MKWISVIRKEIMLFNMNAQKSSVQGIEMIFDQLHDESDECADLLKVGDHDFCRNCDIPSPPLTIVILVVGTRGDVQPFIYLGNNLTFPFKIH
jgi:hypothetical protein